MKSQLLFIVLLLVLQQVVFTVSDHICLHNRILQVFTFASVWICYLMSTTCCC